MSTIISAQPALGSAAGIDPRGPRFAASVTSVALALVLVLPTAAAVLVLALQTVVFAIGAGLGIQHTPYAWFFRTVIRPRLSVPHDLEDPQPPRFAQAVGLGFAAVGLVAFLFGVTPLALVAVGLALVAALLNAVFAFCLGCEIYLLLQRATTR
jgi:hypothetical protein